MWEVDGANKRGEPKMADDVDVATETGLAEELTALLKAKIAKNLEVGTPSVGNHRIDAKFLVELTGKMTVGEDYEQHATNKIDWMSLFAFAVSKLNGQTVKSLVEEFEKANDFSINEKRIKKSAQEVVDGIRGKTKEMFNGKVNTTKVKAKVTKVEETKLS
jgi:hypothetical protein